MALIRNDSHVEQALANRIEQFKTKIRFANLLSSYVFEVQDIEDALFQILDDTNLDTAEGQQLDNIGEIVGEERQGRNDLQYATAIRARILLNTSEATIEDVILLIGALQPGLTTFVYEYFPAAFIAMIATPIDPNVVDIDQIATIVASGRLVGVRGLVSFGVVGSKQFDTSGSGFDEGKFGVVLEA